VLLEQAGLPVPAYPMLFVAGALGMRGGGPSIGAALGAVVVACVLADTMWYYTGKRLGEPMLKTICKVSLSPDTCVRQTQSLYLKVGPRSLVFAKLLPGAGALSTAMAGMTGTALPVFLFYDVIGSVVWAGAALLVGAVFSDFVDAILEAFSNYGHLAVMVVVMALAVFIAWRWWLRVRVLRRTRRVPRMSVSELEALRTDNRLPLVLDVRAHGNDTIERIPGAVVVNPDSPLDALADQPETCEIVIYCSCPHEVSAAILAERLNAAGYVKTWALAGGFEEWKRLHGTSEPQAGEVAY
jgi:membrane protein DedA with SNARE-associated domain/rhodanese-related sulfurtransferase